MKYIFYSKINNSKLRHDIINKSNLKIETDLFGSKKDSSELYVIYDSDTDRISLFNNISKERKTPYRYIDISANSVILFPIILGQINEKLFINVDIVLDKLIIRSLSLDPKDNMFNDLFKNNSFDKPLIFSSFLLMTENIEGLFLNKNVSFKKNINFTISSLFFGKETIQLFREDNLCGISYTPYNVIDENELLGCDFDEFFNGLKLLDITNDLNNHFGNKKKSLGTILHPECEYNNGIFRLRRNDGQDSLKIISIRNNKQKINLRYCDFLDAIDVSADIFQNLISNSKFINKLNIMEICSELNFDKCVIDQINCQILYPPNIFNFNYLAYNLYTYKYNNDLYSNRL